MVIALESTLALLRSYSCLAPKPVSPAEKVPLQKAIAAVLERSEGLNFGICADTVDQALQALCRYLRGLGYDVDLAEIPEHSIAGAAYLKYSLQRQAFYFDDYVGEYRGVLISCQGDDEIAGTYGHFPLDLFD
ncbi:MAG: DUF1824 family protein [Prochlorotrichaceae cyanobacterium]